jgi:hypothetical protein
MSLLAQGVKGKAKAKLIAELKLNFNMCFLYTAAT